MVSHIFLDFSINKRLPKAQNSLSWKSVMLYDILFCFTIGISEDSDYTSDVNFPVHHHHQNSSASQYASSFRRTDRPPMQKQRSALSPYFPPVVNKAPSFEDSSFETQYPPEQHGHDRQQYPEDTRSVHRSNSNASEVLFYNSRPKDRYRLGKSMALYSLTVLRFSCDGLSSC